MRLKHFWTVFPLPSYTKLFWERITFSRLTIIYLSFSILHFLVQLALQVRAFTTNVAAFNAGTLLLQQGHQPMDNVLPFYTNSTLSICKWVPSNLSLKDGSCTVVWPRNSTVNSQNNVASNDPGYVNAPSLVAPVEPTSTQASLSFATPSPIPTTFLSVVAAANPVTSSSSPGLRFTSFIGVVNAPGSSLPTRATSVPVSTTTVTAVFIASTSTTRETPTPTTTKVVVPAGINNSGSVVVVPASDGDRRAGENDDDDDDDDDAGIIFDGDDDRVGGLRSLFSRTDNTDATSTQGSGIDPVCLQALVYPLSILGNTKREDIVFISFQFWVLGMSVVALLNESIPHIFASLVTHIMATAWGGFQLVHTAAFRKEFNVLITNGACRGVSNQLPIALNYWQTRREAEVSSLTLNVLALVVSGFLSWKLFKLFGWQTFKRVGASLVINRVYMLVLTLSIALQLSLFFMTVTVSLWLDRLINIGQLADLRKAYIATSIITLALLVPWLMMGWFGVRRELKFVMLIFLGFCVFYLGGWSVMFVSTTFRWTFITWRFFSIMAVASVLLTVICFILGIICRMNFGKGLTRYLSSQDDLPGGFGIITPAPDHEYGDEKVEFPSTERPTPTFTTAYGGQFSAYGGVPISNGPRFFNQTSQPGMGVAVPPQALTRAPSNGSSYSEKSASSFESYYTYSHSRNDSRRWIIE